MRFLDNFENTSNITPVFLKILKISEFVRANFGQKVIEIKGKIHYQSIVVPQLGNKDVGDFYIEELERIEEENYE